VPAELCWLGLFDVLPDMPLPSLTVNLVLIPKVTVRGELSQNTQSPSLWHLNLSQRRWAYSSSVSVSENANISENFSKSPVTDDSGLLIRICCTMTLKIHIR